MKSKKKLTTRTKEGPIIDLDEAVEIYLKKQSKKIRKSQNLKKKTKYQDLTIDRILPLSNGFVIEWSASLGYGVLTTEIDEFGRIVIDSENMSTDFVHALFKVLINRATIK